MLHSPPGRGGVCWSGKVPGLRQSFEEICQNSIPGASESRRHTAPLGLQKYNQLVKKFAWIQVMKRLSTRISTFLKQYFYWLNLLELVYSKSEFPFSISEQHRVKAIIFSWTLDSVHFIVSYVSPSHLCGWRSASVCPGGRSGTCPGCPSEPHVCK